MEINSKQVNDLKKISNSNKNGKNFEERPSRLSEQNSFPSYAELEHLKKKNKELKMYYEKKLNSYMNLNNVLAKDNDYLRKYEEMYNESQSNKNRLVEKLLTVKKEEKYDDYGDVFGANQITIINKDPESERKEKEKRNRLQKKIEDYHKLKKDYTEIIPNYEKTLDLKDKMIDLLKKKKDQQKSLIDKKKSYETKVEKIEKIETIVENTTIPGRHSVIIRPGRTYSSVRHITPVTPIEGRERITSTRILPTYSVTRPEIPITKRYSVSQNKNNSSIKICPCLQKLLDQHTKSCLCNKNLSDVKNYVDNNHVCEDKSNKDNEDNDFKKGIIVKERNSHCEKKSETKENARIVRSERTSSLNLINERRNSQKKVRINLEDGKTNVYQNGVFVKSEYFDVKQPKKFHEFGDFYYNL
jgi:hypothetical protein